MPQIIITRATKDDLIMSGMKPSEAKRNEDGTYTLEIDRELYIYLMDRVAKGETIDEIIIKSIRDSGHFN